MIFNPIIPASLGLKVLKKMYLTQRVTKKAQLSTKNKQNKSDSGVTLVKAVNGQKVRVQLGQAATIELLSKAFNALCFVDAVS